MVRKYTKKRDESGNEVRRSFSDDDLIAAVTAVHNGWLTVRLAAERYGITKSTLARSVNEQTAISDVTKKHIGRNTLLSEEEERLLIESIVTLGEFGFSRDKDDILEIVKNYLQ